MLYNNDYYQIYLKLTTGSKEFIILTCIQKTGQMDGCRAADDQKSPPEFQFWRNKIMVALTNGVNFKECANHLKGCYLFL